MSFTPKVWADNPAGATPITAAELARVELGIDQAYGRSANALAGATLVTETVIASWDLPAGTVSVADMLQVRAFGQAGGIGTLTFRLRFGTAGTAADALLLAFPATAAGAANAHWQVNALVATLTATTATATGHVQLVNAITGPATAAFAAATVNLAVANKLTLTVAQSVAATFATRAASIGWLG